MLLFYLRALGLTTTTIWSSVLSLTQHSSCLARPSSLSDFNHGDLVRWLGGEYTAHRDWDTTLPPSTTRRVPQPEGYPPIDIDLGIASAPKS
jgi:hypothetical protein